LDDSPIPGTGERVSLQRGQPSTILKAFMADLHWYVESMDNGGSGGSYQDEGGWTATNSVPTSNHLGGTAFDYNWRDHPMGPQVPDPAAGWQGSEITRWQPEEPRVRELLDYYEGTVFWANDWDQPHDSMHFQMGYDTFGNVHTQSFIDRKIDVASGFSRFKEDLHQGEASVDVAMVLAEAMQPSPVAVARFAELVSNATRCLIACDCTTPERISMWCAQVGTESGGLHYQQEIADGSAYEGRADLGNTQPGDGRRFKGRDFIQITGRHNYTQLSRWAHENGIVDSPTFFIDDPEALATDEYAFVGVTWYWTAARPTLNEAADNEDVVTATHLVNGGEHGLVDRQDRYQRCREMGERILELIADKGKEEDQMAGLVNHAGLSAYRDNDDPVGWGTEVDYLNQAMLLDLNVEHMAILGEAASVEKVRRVAENNAPVAVEEWQITRAAIIYAEVPKTAQP
jgi:predicted chitinase